MNYAPAEVTVMKRSTLPRLYKPFSFNLFIMRIEEFEKYYSINLFLVGDTVISGTGEVSLYDLSMSMESP